MTFSLNVVNLPPQKTKKNRNNQDNYPLMDYPPISTNPETDSSSTAFTLPTEAIYGIFVVITVLIAAVAILKLRKH